MARIRTIKPEFWADEKLAPLTPIDRLVFLGLISQADDAGRLVDSVRLIDGLLFPHTEDSCGESLESLRRVSVIWRYTSESGQKLIQIVGWEKHQKVKNPSLYTLPGPCAESLPTPSVDSTEEVRRADVDPHAPTPDPLPPIPDPRPTTNDQLPTPPTPSKNGGGVDKWLLELKTAVKAHLHRPVNSETVTIDGTEFGLGVSVNAAKELLGRGHSQADILMAIRNAKYVEGIGNEPMTLARLTVPAIWNQALSEGHKRQENLR